ncbi:MAG: lysine--tRNA ligase [Chloroflexota bacterium]
MATRLERVFEQRLEKLKRIRELGLNPYPNTFHRTHTTAEAIELLKKAEASPETKAEKVTVAGRITANRGMGKISFMDLRDDSGKIQLLLRKDALDETTRKLIEELDIGDIIGASGKLLRTRSGEPTVEVESLTLLTKSLQPLPEKFHGLADVELRFRRRYLDLIANAEVKESFELRSRIITALRSFLNGRGFLEVETPVLQPAAGGALARPVITHHHALDQDFYLRIALELHLKRLIIGGFDKVYEIGRVFRNEGIDLKHDPEFTMLESYEAYADYRDVMKMVEDVVSGIALEVLGKDSVEYGGNTISLETPWRRLDLREALIQCAGIDFLKTESLDDLRKAMQEKGIAVDPQKDKGRLIDELISTFVEPVLIQPTFLVDYPIEMSPLAKTKPGTGDRVVERFEAFVGGMEIANAFTELNNPLEQRERFARQQSSRHGDHEEKWTIDEDFVLALEHGMPPTGGLGIGIDRLVMLFTGKESIREVIFFPHLKEKD